jgi:hypothetical protein
MEWYLHPYTGCFTTLGHNCRRWFPRSLDEKVHTQMKRRHIYTRRRGITLKKIYYTQNTAKVWNQEYFIHKCVRFWTVTELWPFFNSRTRARLNLTEPAGGSCTQLSRLFLPATDSAVPVISILGTRAVHNWSAACVAAGGGIFENQL